MNNDQKLSKLGSLLRIDRLSTRIAIYFAVFFILAGLITVIVVNIAMREQALDAAREKAKIILDHNLAIHTYFTHQLKPSIFPLSKKEKSAEYFDPVWMSSTYAVREIYKYFTELNLNGYTYKECAIDARSLKNEADPIERGFLRRLNQDEKLVLETMVRDIDGEPFFVLLRRGETMQQSCLRCHSKPQRAPQDLVAIYGSDRSFDREVDEVVSAISIRIPLKEAFAQVRRVSLVLTTILVAILLILYAGLSLLNYRLLFVPLRDMAAKARRIAGKKEHLGETVGIPKGSEMREIAISLNFMSKRLKEHLDDLEGQVQSRSNLLSKVNAMLHQEKGERQQTAQELQKHARQLEHLARRDELTQAFNRRYFMQQLDKELDRARRYQKLLSVAILDLDHFKDVNDTYGHASGDAVLQTLSNTCNSTLRKQDVFGRLGGEEFGILLPETGPKEARQTAERIRELVQKMEVTGEAGHLIRITASLGVTSLSKDDKDLESILRRTDRALYAAKNAGRNRVEFKG